MIPAGVAWLVTIVLLSFPAWMLASSILAWVGAFGFIALGRLTGKPWLVVGALSCAAAALLATAASSQSDARRPEFLAKSQSISSATVVTTQTAVPSSRFFAATVVLAGDRTVSVPVLVFGAALTRRTEIGTSLRLSGSLIATDPNDEVSYLVFARGETRVIAPPPWYLSWANGLRAGLAGAATSLPGDGGALLPGLAIGDTTAVSPTLNANMKAASLTHLTAVSGANCAVVIGLILLVGQAIGLSRGVRIAAALAVLVGFVVLVTPQPSVLRSAIMAALVLGALARGRPASGLPVVGITVIALLAYDPWLAVDYGFALSVLATAGLMTMTAPISRLLEEFLPRWLAISVAVPLAAQLACQPVLVLLNPSLPLYGVIANSLAEPASPVATVIGLLACVSLPVVPPVGHVLTAIAWVPSAWIAAVATFFSGLPGARLPWAGGFVGALSLAAVTVALLVVMFARVSRRHRIVIAGAAGILLIGTLGAAAAIPGLGVAPAATRSDAADTLVTIIRSTGRGRCGGTGIEDRAVHPAVGVAPDSSRADRSRLGHGRLPRGSRDPDPA
ncbi:MAG TPA: ComEC/Rec2 family competence protein [Galbitalea sp.]|nr:ComEC/Rec2 family competence protein [Galbitalea sp.]